MSSRGYVYDQWRIDLEDLHHTPSIKDGKTYEEERIARSKGCMFITSLGNSLRVTQIVIASASVFFHRFFLRNSFKDHHFYVSKKNLTDLKNKDVGAACLFLATKTEECGRHLDDIVRDVMKHCSKTENFKVEKDSKEFKTWKRIIIFYEELVLEAVCFDLEIDHPYKQMIKFSESLGCSDKLSRSAWAFLNDRTTLCLTHDNEVIAAAAIFIASKYLDEPLPYSEAPGESWWDHMCVDVEQVQVASHLILDLYASLKQSP